LTEVTQTSKILTQNFVTVPRKVPEGPLNIVGLTRPSLREALIENGTPEKQANMRVGQIWQWIYEKGVRDFSKMTNLAKPYREALEKNFWFQFRK
jgi:23S rRNA (adenine2503-C2)-methyltransferase